MKPREATGGVELQRLVSSTRSLIDWRFGEAAKYIQLSQSKNYCDLFSFDVLKHGDRRNLKFNFLFELSDQEIWVVSVSSVAVVCRDCSTCFRISSLNFFISSTEDICL